MDRGFRIVAVLLMLSVVACQSMTGKTAGESIDAAAITAAVKAKLVADKPANLTRVDVDTKSVVNNLPVKK